MDFKQFRNYVWGMYGNNTISRSWELYKKSQHALWIARAERAKLEIRYWQYNNRNFYGYRFNVRHEITTEGRYAMEWIMLWMKINRLCLEKAKEFE